MRTRTQIRLKDSQIIDPDNQPATPENPEAAREIWIQRYSARMLKSWLRWQTSLGVARDYVEQLQQDLADYYDEPLKKTFIEMTY